MITLKSLVKEFDSYFLNMYYDEALQVVGKMKCSNFENQARLYEALVYFEQGKYEKVRLLYKDYKKEKMMDESELYICSLLELELFDEYTNALKNVTELSLYCYAYIYGIVTSRKYEKKLINELENVKIISGVSKYMDRRYRWFIANTLADIYALNEERIQMIDASISKDEINNLGSLIEIKENCLNIIKDIPEWNSIKNSVKKKEHIDINKIILLVWKYCADRDIDGNVDLVYMFTQSLYNYIHYFDLCMKIGKEHYELDFFVESNGLFINGMERGNEYLIDFVKRMYIDVKNDSFMITDKLSLADALYSGLKKAAPYSLKDLNNHSNDKKIESTLSKKGKIAYKSALWQYEHFGDSIYNTVDAGMLCLSYMRLLELELNERLINKVLKKKDKLIKIYDTQKEALEKRYDSYISEFGMEKNHNHKEDWKGLIIKIKNIKKNLELGSMYYLLKLVSEIEYNESDPYNELAKEVRNMFENYLTESGMQVLLSGDMAEMINDDIRNNFRNPPAHTRYVGNKVALECRKHVEENLLKLAEYIKV